MKIILIGYGKMGKTIERLASERGHHISGIIDIDTSIGDRKKALATGEVAIEFSHPEAAYANICEAIECGIPVISGTTGWLDQMDNLKNLVAKHKGSFLYSSNFSIGVNILYEINEKLAKLMNQHNDYSISIDETHHIHKKDAPSGTAISLAKGIMKHNAKKSDWTLNKPAQEEIKINAFREGEIFGQHKVRYASKIDTIELYHDAHSRDGFALGAITAAQWIIGKPGVHTMRDVLEG